MSCHLNRNWTNQGRVFEGETDGIDPYNSFSGTKEAFAERAIRALNVQIVRYFGEDWMQRYFDKLPDFLKSLYDSVHRSIGMRPSKVEKKHVLKLIALETKLCSDDRKKPMYKVGDFVRLASNNVLFRREIYNTLRTNFFFNFHIVLHSSTHLHFAR